MIPQPGIPSTQYLRPLVPITIKGMVFGTSVLKYWVLGSFGFHRRTKKIKGAHITGPATRLTLAFGMHRSLLSSDICVNLCVCIYYAMYIYIYTQLHAYTHAFISCFSRFCVDYLSLSPFLFTSLHVYIHIYVYMYIPIHLSTSLPVYLYIYIHTYIYTCAFM